MRGESPRAPLTCEEVLRRLDAYVDRELSDRDQSAMRAHVAKCATCAAEVRFEARTLAELRGTMQRIRLPETVAAQIEMQLRTLRRRIGPH